MKTTATGRAWGNGTAYQLARQIADGKRTNISEAKGLEEGAEGVKSGDSSKETSKAGADTAEKYKVEEGTGAEGLRTDVFLSSIKQKETMFPGLYADKTSKDSDNFQMKTSAPEDSVGQLAAMLAKAETKLDVLQVSGKAIRALASLKAAAASSEGEDAKKVARQIRRMEKLMKRIEKKLKHLSKEEQLELEKKRALEKKEQKKADGLADELKSRRKKRRRDEKNYAAKELAEDEKEASAETMAALAGGSSASMPSVTEMAAGMDAVAGGEMAAVDGMSLDISV
ncbi:MAG: hypothetical protein HFI63_06190 [Lachnospiraceae bacterium]|nr:hypothetical protein [Lachnospiraceae bacterium]